MCSLSTCKKLRIWHALCWPFDRMSSQPRCSFQDTSSMSISQNFRNEGGNLYAHRHPRPLPQWCPRLLGVREPCRQPEGSSGQACGAGPCCLRPAGAGCWAAAHATLCSTAQHVFNMASFSLWLDWVLLHAAWRSALLPCRQPGGLSRRTCAAGLCWLHPAGPGCWAADHATLRSRAPGEDLAEAASRLISSVGPASSRLTCCLCPYRAG